MDFKKELAGLALDILFLLAALKLLVCCASGEPSVASKLTAIVLGFTLARWVRAALGLPKN